MPAVRTIRASHLDEGSDLLQAAQIVVDGQELHFAYIDGFQRGLGITPDELTFTIRAPETLEQLTSRVDNYKLNVIGHREATFGPAGRVTPATEVALISGGVALWRGFVVKRKEDLDRDAIVYTAQDIRCMLRETVAGSLVNMRIEAGGLKSIRYTHRRQVFNIDQRPNMDFYHVFSEFGADENIAAYWGLADAIEYLFNLRDYQAVAYGVAFNSSGTQAIRFHVLDDVELIDVRAITEGMHDNSVSQEEQGQSLNDQLRGGLDGFDPNGRTYLEAVEHICNLHGMTLATGVGGVLKSVPLSVDVLTYVNTEPLDLAPWFPAGVEKNVDWTDSYGGAVNVGQCAALECTVTLQAAWDDHQLRIFHQDYRAGYANLGYLNLAAYLKACESNWPVFTAYRCPVPVPILAELAHVDPVTDDPLRVFQIWAQDPDSGTWIPIAPERAAIQLDPLRNMILMPGLRYRRDNVNYTDETTTFTALNLKMTFAVENFLAQPEYSAIAALQGATGITFAAQTITPDTLKVKSSVQANFKAFEEPPPPILLYNLSNARQLRLGTSSPVPGENIITTGGSLFWANRNATAYQSSPVDEDDVLRNVDDENQLGAARALYAHRPKYTARGRLMLANLALTCGQLCKLQVQTANGTKTYRFLLSHINHTFPGSDRPGDMPTDIPTGTEFESL